jgi:hypothetical protein
MKDRQHNGQKIPKVQSEAVYQWRIYNTMGKWYERCNQKPYINEGYICIFFPLCCLSFIDVRLLIAPLVSFAHWVVYPSLIYGFWLHLWYPLLIVLAILHWFTASDCTFGIFCSLCYLSFIDLRLVIAPLVSFAYCVYILHWFTASDCTFGIFCSLCCLSFIDLRLLIAPLVSFVHCVVYPSLIYGFWLHLWYLFPIVLYVLHWFTASDCIFGIFCPLCCMSFIDVRLLITPLVSFVHCVVYPSYTTQWTKDTKGAIRSRISMKDRQHNGQKIPKVQSEAVNQWRRNNTMGKRYQRCNQKP